MIILATYTGFQCHTKTNMLVAWKQVHFMKLLKEPFLFLVGWIEAMTVLPLLDRTVCNSIGRRKEEKLTAQLHKLFRMLLIEMNLLGEFLIQAYGVIGSTVYMWGLWK